MNIAKLDLQASNPGAQNQSGLVWWPGGRGKLRIVASFAPGTGAIVLLFNTGTPLALEIEPFPGSASLTADVSETFDIDLPEGVFAVQLSAPAAADFVSLSFSALTNP